MDQHHTAALAADGLAMLPGVLEPELASELLQHVDQRLALERLAIERSQCRAHMETLFGRTDRAQRAIEAGLQRCGEQVSLSAAAHYAREAGAPAGWDFGRRLLALQAEGPPSVAAGEGLGQVHGRLRGSETVRWDLKLRLDPLVRRALQLLGQRVGGVLETALGRSPVLVELAALISEPGAEPQPVHTDTVWLKRPHVVTCFVALQEVEQDMGPTLMLPGTHASPEYLQRAIGMGEARHQLVTDPSTLKRVLGTPEVVRCTCQSGSAIVMDSRLLHCGGRNSSSKRRVLFYASFQRRADASSPTDEEYDKGLEEWGADIGSTMTLLDEYRGRFDITDFL